MRRSLALATSIALALMLAVPAGPAVAPCSCCGRASRLSGELVDMGASGLRGSAWAGQPPDLATGDVVAVIDFSGSTSFPATRSIRSRLASTCIVLSNGQMMKGHLVRRRRHAAEAHLGHADGATVTSAPTTSGGSTSHARAGVPRCADRQRPRRAGLAPATRTGSRAGRPAMDRHGLTVRRGERVTFNATGAGPVQHERQRHGRVGRSEQRTAPTGAPVTVLVGALVGRIGTGAPFAIGNQTSTAAPADRQLFLAVNDDGVGDNAGEFGVDVGPIRRLRPGGGRFPNERRGCPGARRIPPQGLRSTIATFIWRIGKRHAEPAPHRLSDEGQPARRPSRKPSRSGRDGSVRALRERRAGATEVRPARRAALRQRADSPRHGAQQDPQGPRRQVPVDGGVRRAVRPRLRLPRPADRAEGRPRAGPEEAADGAGRLPPRVPRLRRALHRRDDRGVPAARACSATGRTRT